MKEKIKKIKANKKIIGAVAAIFIMLLLIGGSYAAYRYNFLGANNLINTESIELEFLESSGEIIDIPSAFPMIDSVGIAQEETFDFQVKTKTRRNMDITYELYIEKLTPDSGYTFLNDSEVKVYLTDFNNNEKVVPVKVNELTNYSLYTETNSHNSDDSEQTDKYKLRIWIDEEVTAKDWDANTKLQYKFKIGVRTVEPPTPANKPVLSDNMIPVYYDETCNETEGCWRKADSTNENEGYKWYDYDNKVWANSVTVSTNDEGIRTDLTQAPEGTEIPMDRILTMQVWIPRYKYTVWNYNSDGTVTSEPQEIDIQFESGTTTTGEIECTDLTNMGTSDGTKNGTQKTTSETCVIKSTSATCTNSTCNGKTYTHPAFTFGNKELTGFWVGKFEVSSDISCFPYNVSAIGTDCNLTSIRPLVKPNVTSWRGVMVGTFENNMMAMNDASNKYGFSTTDDTHVMKNMEWGAVAYLSHSKYGLNKEIAINSANSYTTGCGPQSEGSTDFGSICNAYNTTLGQSASTTGNIYGVYDMSGGSSEYVMGNIVSPDGNTMMSGNRADTSYPNNHSGYSGILYYNGTTSDGYGSYTGTYEYPDTKYYDKYSFNTSYSTRGISKLGDAIKEVYNTSSYVWYSDRFYFAYSNYPWFKRGGIYHDGSKAGVFHSDFCNGAANLNFSSRLVISQ